MGLGRGRMAVQDGVTGGGSGSGVSGLEETQLVHRGAAFSLVTVE